MGETWKVILRVTDVNSKEEAIKKAVELHPSLATAYLEAEKDTGLGPKKSVVLGD